MNNDLNKNGLPTKLEILIEKFKIVDFDFMAYFEKEYPKRTGQGQSKFLDFLNANAAAVHEMLVRSINQRAFAKAA